MLTPFGIELRKLRLDKGLRLLDLAKRLDQSSSFVSAVETGRKSIPDDYVENVAVALRLDAAKTALLQSAADRTREAVKVDSLPANQRELVAAFARKVDQFPPEVLADLQKLMLKSREGDIPFRRKAGLCVAPMSTKDLRKFSELVRSVFTQPNQVEFPVIDVIEFKLESIFPGFFLEVCSRAEMGDDEGCVVAGQTKIMLREDVYEGACHGVGRHRFTACHELGHFLMHREMVMARTRDVQQPIYRDAEWQADVFAGGLLMSARHANSFVNAEDAAAKCGITPAAARVMLSKYQKEGLM